MRSPQNYTAYAQAAVHHRTCLPNNLPHAASHSRLLPSFVLGGRGHANIWIVLRYICSVDASKSRVLFSQSLDLRADFVASVLLRQDGCIIVVFADVVFPLWRTPHPPERRWSLGFLELLSASADVGEGFGIVQQTPGSICRHAVHDLCSIEEHFSQTCFQAGQFPDEVLHVLLCLRLWLGWFSLQRLLRLTRLPIVAAVAAADWKCASGLRLDFKR